MKSTEAQMLYNTILISQHSLGLPIFLLPHARPFSFAWKSALSIYPTYINMYNIAHTQMLVAWKPAVKKIGLWQMVRSLARLYDAAMGMFIFVPLAIFAWFPFLSTFQTRLLFNQAFSRGLEISLILAGNNPNPGLWDSCSCIYCPFFVVF